MGTVRDGIVALLPAAGFGSRMGSRLPKQYHKLTHESVLKTTLNRLQSVPAVTAVVVVVAAPEVDTQSRALAPVHVACGGDSRAQSVINGLEYIQRQLDHNGRVLVHDAARPCVRIDDINRLIDETGDCSQGGILAIPVHDTLKRASDDNHIVKTVSRANMWRAVTPQLFRVDVLLPALRNALESNQQITDEASAMEYAGYAPRLVAGAQDNIKITVAEDLPLARVILQSQEPQ